ncbi:basic region leucine zipper [Colletotrichum truncatum]|uniref:Basic region leucine zipper n=1 Tax=Colletotrichum truncatum TaxID=5467 RepID=A0ACC3Z0S3_COLTU
MAEAPNMPITHYATPPEQDHLLSPNGDYIYQPWLRWDGQVTEPMYAPSSSENSMNSLSWEAQGHQNHPINTSGVMAEYTRAGLAPRPNDWLPPYQQQQQERQQEHVQLYPNQPSVYGSPPQWQSSECFSHANSPSWHPQSDAHPQQQPEVAPPAANTRAGKKSNGKRPPSNAQQPTKKSRVGNGGNPSPANSSSYDDGAQWVEGDGEDDDKEDDRPTGRDTKKTYRVKNRAAAKRCREKTKQYELDLAAKEKQVTQERLYLDACVAALKNEVLTLKNQILQHGDCDCEIIQGYIARAANGVSSAHRGYSISQPSA